MNRWKRHVLGIFFASALVVVLSLTVSAAEVKVSGAEEAKALLTVITGDDTWAYDSENKVTRLDFVQRLIQTIRMENAGKIDGTFADVENEQVLYDALALGIVSRSEQFRPGDAVTMDEALKMILVATGRKVLAEEKGGYPSGYRLVAAEEEFLKGIDVVYGEITGDDMCMLLYNMLINNEFQLGAVRDDHVLLTEGEDSMLYRLYGISTMQGLVTQTHVNSYDESFQPRSFNTVCINGESFSSEEAYLELFGKKCNVYFKEDEIVLLYPVNNNETEFSLRDSWEAEAHRISYMDDDGRKKHYNLDAGYVMVYNGRTVTPDFSLAVGKNGRMRLLDNDRDGEYEIVFLDVLSYVSVKNIDIQERLIEDLNSAENNISFDEDEVYALFYDETGAVLRPFQIESGNVLAVYKSLDSLFVRIHLLGLPFVGTLTQLNAAEELYYVDGKAYYLSDYAEKYYSDKLRVGMTAQFVADSDDNIICIDNVSGNYQYAVLLYTDYSVGIDPILQLKLFNESGSIEILETDKEIMLDGVKKTAANVFYQMHCEGQMIRYATNQTGKVTKIDTCETVIYNDLNLDWFTAERSYDNQLTQFIYPVSDFVYKSSGTCDEYFNINGGKFLLVPDDFSNENAFSVLDYSQLGSGMRYAMEVYDVDGYGNAKIAIIRGDLESLNMVMNTYIVNDVLTAVRNGEMGRELELWQNGTFVHYFLPDDVEFSVASGSSLKAGDIIRASVSDDVITKLIVDFDSGTMSGNRSNDSRAATINGGNVQLTYQAGQLFRLQDGMVLLSSMQNGGQYDFSPQNLRCYSLGTSKIALYDSRLKRVETITADDIRTYQHIADDADFIVIKQDSFNTKVVFVYR